jgi:serine/threonine protein kinase
VEPGQVVADRYEILALLAEGTSSHVWEARDGASGERVALKVVSLEEAGWRAEVRDRFLREARLLARVRHEHLVGVREIGETDDGLLYLVLDLLRGETLGERLARPPRLSWREAAALGLEIGRGLAALHAAGIVHRDLKPANVILHRGEDDDAASCKLIDLGISKASAVAADPVLAETLTSTGQVLGTPEYMSYEQALGERDVDARADVWALGAVLHEMLAGRRAFSGPNPNAVLAAVRRAPAPPLAGAARGVPEALGAVVDRCLARARGDRYADGAELCDALEEAVRRGEAEEARAGRRRALLLAGAAVLAAGAAATALGSHRP